MFKSGLIPLLLLATTGCRLLPPLESSLLPHRETRRDRADKDWREITSERWVTEAAFGCVSGRVASAGYLGLPLRGLEVFAHEGNRRAGVSHTAADGTFKFCFPRASRSLVDQVAEGLVKVMLGFVASPGSYRDRDLELRLEVRAPGYAPWSRSLTWNTAARAHLDVELEPLR